MLILEDVAADAELMVAELRRAGFAPDWHRVDTEAAYTAHLGPHLDLVLAAHRLPSFDARRALQILAERGLDVPFIIVSADPGEDLAVACMQQGASDYLIRNRLARLGPAVDRALEQTRLRQTHRQVQEAALRQSEEIHRLITETVRDAIAMTDLNGRIVFANRATEEISGYSLAELLERSLSSLLTSPGAREFDARLASVRGGQEVSPWFEAEITRKDGTRVWVEAQVASVLRDGRVTGRIGVIRDVSERRREQELLRLLGSAVRQAGDAIMVTTSDLDPPGPQILYVNPTTTRVSGYTAEEMIGRTPRMLQGPLSNRAMLHRVREELSAGREYFGETINYRKDGTPFPVSLHIAPVRDGHGRVTHFLGIQRDLTEQKRAEEQLASQRETLYQSEKLAAMGQLLAGVAHELNNPLSVLLGHATILQQTAAGAVGERAAKIAAAADRCARIVRNFLALARQHPTQRRRANLNDVARDAVELLAYSLRVESVAVSLDLAPDLPVLWGDVDQLHQVIVNLISNAQQAMRGSAQPRRLAITTRHRAGRITLEVTDTGPGVPAEIRPKIFEPFFTTKPVGLGTGLGLALCKSIVEGHGGEIVAEAAPGQGARFVIEIPVAAPPDEVERVPAGSAVSTAPPSRILVVDDEPEIAELLAEILAGAGHDVQTATSGAQALDRIRATAFDVVVSDMRMPDLDGPGLYREVERFRPELARRWVFVTGDVLGPDTTAFLDHTGSPMLAKPFDPEDLLRIVAQLTAPG